ncbi:MAG: DNA gyrase subunit A [Acetobacteraceae bacterium]|nr:DNA gyrase subunit A [Acetobacteraceae bacterium]
MRRSYIDYAMSVIVARALPDVRDGLKPVHRRILYAMLELGLTPDRPFKKAARVVGEVLGKFHPHGELSVYDAIVRLAQDFSSRYPLIEGHGNFGSVDGDPAAAMRYTEARLSALAMEMLADIRKETVDFAPNFDESLEEPVVLPSRFPNLLVNGSSGIAVGMATNIPPHNLREVTDALLFLIDHPDAGVPELMRFIKGPDFPTAGQILGTGGIKDAYSTGRGLLRVRGRAEIETTRAGRTQIVITEIPYQVSKARLVEKIAELVRERRIDGVTDLRDETDRRGMRVVLEVRRDADPRVILNRLFKFTSLEQTFGVILLALVGGEPRVLTLPQLLRHYLEHQKDVVLRRTRYDLKRAEERAHVLEGLRTALDHLDRVVEIIRGSRTVEAARDGLMKEFSLSDIQARAILDMRLARLVGLERQKVEEEYAETRALIEKLQAILASEALQWQVVKDELSRVRDRYGDDRRTRIVRAPAELEPEDLIAREQVVVTISHQGYIKRTPLSVYRNQRRGGRGLAGAAAREEDFLEHLFIATTHDHLLFFTSRGKAYRLRAFDLPEMGRQARGQALVNLLQLRGDERVTAVIPVRALDEAAHLLMVTRQGRVKRTELGEFAHTGRAGLLALRLRPQDELVAVLPVTPGWEAVLVSQMGQATRFPVDEARPMGRVAGGVAGMRLRQGDAVVAAGLAVPGADLLVVTARGFGKRTPLDAFRTHHRGAAGVKALRITDRTGPVAGAAVVREDDGVVLLSSAGVLMRVRAREISRQSRNTQGVTVMRLDPGDTLAALARVNDEDQGAMGPGGERGDA